jgi:hypothetical protein
MSALKNGACALILAALALTAVSLAGALWRTHAQALALQTNVSGIEIQH